MAKKSEKLNKKGRYSYEGLDRIMHEKARLGILTCLLTRPQGLRFSDLKELCSLTDGNLSRHIKVLEEENLVAIQKSFQHNRPQTLCCLTETGRERFLAYIQELERVVWDAATAMKLEETTENARLVIA